MATKNSLPQRSLTLVNDSPDTLGINLSHFGFENIDPKKAYVDSHSYHAYRLHYIIKGGVLLHYKGEIISLQEKTFYILRPDLEIGYSPDKTKKTTIAWVAFTGKSSVEILSHLKLDGETPFLQLSANSDLPKKVINTFSDVFETKRIYHGSEILNVVLLKHLFRLFELIYLANPQPEKNAKLNLYAQFTLEYINEHYSDPELTIRTVATHLALHPNYLSKILKENLAMNFTDILTQKRIEKAVALFSKGEKSVSTVAYSVGFNDPLYFSKVYKKLNGGYAPKGAKKKN